MRVETFHEAVKHGDVDTVRRGLEGGLQDGVQLKDFKKFLHIGGIDNTPLHLASMFGYAEVAELLIQYGDDIEAKNVILMSTPLHEAAGNGNIEICELLVRSGADILALNKSITELPANGSLMRTDPCNM
uniref:Uncharacterized protein n=1 Tax=Branchiostoma floridae TaxID=7739 RepID=C3YRN9_BRAFL|eukprot:XP_002600782.1 hypothetical protein BRAFLDRAFT_95068 [Branchiostoma floridae]